MKRLAIAVVLSASLNAFADEPIDLATYWPETPTETQTLPEGSYTLSADYTLPVGLNMKQGSVFNFPDGKTFTVDGDMIFQNPYKDKTTILKGGAWNVMKPINCDSSGTSLSNYKLFLDGTSLTTTRAFFVPSGAQGDVLLALTNGATLTVTGNDYSEFCRKRTVPGYSFLLDISGGSKLNMGSSSFYFLVSGGGDADVLQNATVRVRGSGSEVTEDSVVSIGQYSPGYTLEVCDGGKVSTSHLRVGEGGNSHDNTVFVRGAGSTLSAIYPSIGEQATGANYRNATSNNWVYVLDGATATISTDYHDDLAIGPYSANNGVYVSNATFNASAVYIGKKPDTDKIGASSTAGSDNALHITGGKTTAKMTMGWQNHRSMPYRPFGAGPRCAIKVEDGASLDAYNASLGVVVNGTNCLVRVAGTDAAEDKKATFKMKGFVFAGRNNRIEVADGGSLTCDAFSTGVGTESGTGNRILVSNATLSASSFRLGAESAAESNNVFTLAGPSSALTVRNITNPYLPFGAGANCAFNFEDGAQFATSSAIDLCGTNCLFRVSGTNTVAQKCTSFDARNIDLTGKGSTLEVSDGAKLVCYLIHTYRGEQEGADNTIIVSNGTLNCGQYWGLFLKGSSNKLVLRGNAPYVYGPAYLVPHNGAKVVFELPLGKTEYVQPPLKFAGIYTTINGEGDVDGTGADPEILFPNILDYQESIEQTVNLVLANASFSARMQQVVADTNAKLPKGCKLTYSSSQLKLQVKPIRGLLMIVR